MDNGFSWDTVENAGETKNDRRRTIAQPLIRENSFIPDKRPQVFYRASSTA
jgi:hypothetical protein